MSFPAKLFFFRIFKTSLHLFKLSSENTFNFEVVFLTKNAKRSYGGHFIDQNSTDTVPLLKRIFSNGSRTLYTESFDVIHEGSPLLSTYRKNVRAALILSSCIGYN